MRLAAKLAASGTARAVRVVNRIRALQAVLIVLMVWFKEFFALYRLAYALI